MTDTSAAVVAGWLRDHGINPDRIPTRGCLQIARDEAGTHIRWREIVTDDIGRVTILDGRPAVGPVHTTLTQDVPPALVDDLNDDAT